MSEMSSPFVSPQGRGNWIRLRTIILVRWIAVGGQLAALLVAQFLFKLDLVFGLCYLAVGISAIGNLLAIFLFPETKRLKERENAFMILFDLLQLCFLLFLTGGLNNPFSVLVVGPVVVSAGVLTLRSTLLLGAITIALVTVMLEYHLPLRTGESFILRIPDIFQYGNWFAIVIATVFLAIYSRRVTSEISSMSEALTATQMALSRAQKLTDLGGVVAAAAHELGTPLATIKLTSSELMEELEDRPDLHEDAALIREQADRCRDILRSMGRAGKDDLHLRSAPLSAVLEEAAEPHGHRGKELVFELAPDVSARDTPNILRRPETIHGLRNLIQNAVDFAESTVWIETGWNEETVSIRIMDDGRGYPSHILGRIGDPFMRRKRSDKSNPNRPEYEGMGLGLFIAKTLLERTGAELSFANGTSSATGRTGAIVEVSWPKEIATGSRDALAENPNFLP